MITEFAELSGVTISRKWEPRVTHVIASINENGACRRTLKFMMGILEGKWILSIDCKYILLFCQQRNMHVWNHIKATKCYSVVYLLLPGIKACMKDTKYVSEEPYEISMDVHGIREGPHIGRQRALNKVKFRLSVMLTPVFRIFPSNWFLSSSKYAETKTVQWTEVLHNGRFRAYLQRVSSRSDCSSRRNNPVQAAYF